MAAIRLTLLIDEETKTRIAEARERWKVRARADEPPTEQQVLRGLLRHALALDEAS